MHTHSLTHTCTHGHTGHIRSHTHTHYTHTLTHTHTHRLDIPQAHLMTHHHPQEELLTEYEFLASNVATREYCS